MNKVWAEFRREVYVENDQLAKLLSNKLTSILSGGDYIEDGIIYCDDYRFNNPVKIREASEEEIKRYEAYNIVISDFSKK